MTPYERIRAEPCSCGAKRGESCRPVLVSGGYHAERLRAAGVPIDPRLRGPEYARPVTRSADR